MTQQTASFDDLISGYRRFRKDGWTEQRERWTELAKSQTPRVMVIACSDSRVDPMQIFDVSPGEIFVVRNVANLVPPFEETPGYHGVSAAVEFAVTQLEVEDVFVMGHASCGGVKAALGKTFADAPVGGGRFIADWLSLLNDTRDQIEQEFGHEATHELELATVKLSLGNLRTFPFVAEREQAGKLRLRGGHFAIADGLLHLLDEEEQEFHVVEA